MKLFLKTKPTHNVFISDGSGGLAVLSPQKPPLPSESPPRPVVDAAHVKYLEEYAQLAAQIGIKPLHAAIECFRVFLVKHGITVFSSTEVVGYMDELSKKEGTEGAGWEWRPLRNKDQLDSITFGRKGQRTRNSVTPASDYYRGLNLREYDANRGDYVEASPIPPYDRLIPLHALRKVALIEREFKEQVAFFVSDYAPLPEIEYPDPFLMAIVPNPDIKLGKGRFIIDFWDEPGFGLEKQLKLEGGAG